MEVVIVIQPDDWPDDSDCESRIFGGWKSQLAAEAAVREAVKAEADKMQEDGEWQTAEQRQDWEDDECERFAYEVMDVND